MVFVPIYSKRENDLDISDFTRITIKKFKELNFKGITLLGFKDNNFIYYYKINNKVFIAMKETNIRKDNYWVVSLYEKNEITKRNTN